jgi:hypothetical protein
MNTKPGNDHLAREWEQAWNHYRHLETTRTQYLGFFFTVLVASIGLAVGLLKDVKPPDLPAVLFGLFVLAEVVFLITLGLYTAIKKTGYVLKRYETIINSVRNKSDFASSKDFPFDLSDMIDYPAAVLDAKVYSVQRTAELTLGVISVGLISLLLISAGYIVFGSSLKFSCWHKMSSIIIVVSSAVYLAFVFFPLAKERWRKRGEAKKSVV